MTSIKKTVGAVSLGVVLLGATAACSSNSSSDTSSATWKLGVEAPLTGDQSTLGQGMLQGAQLAADQVNTAGGGLGRKIEIIKIDDAANAATGVAAANAAIAAGYGNERVISPLSTLSLCHDRRNCGSRSPLCSVALLRTTVMRWLWVSRVPRGAAGRRGGRGSVSTAPW